MRRRLARLLVGLYPRRWRDRYGDELDSVLEEARLDLPALLDLAGAGMRERLRVLLPPLWSGAGAFIVLAPCFMVLQIQALMLGQLVATMAGHPLSLDVRVGPVVFWSVEQVDMPHLVSATSGPGAVALAALGGAAPVASRRGAAPPSLAEMRASRAIDS